MPKWYRLREENINNVPTGVWKQLKDVYRLREETINNTPTGVWKKIKTIYRLNGSGSWGIVHNSEAVPVATTSPTLLNQNSSPNTFFGGDTLTLTRGAYTETTTDSNTTYRLRIYKGTDASLTLNATNWTVVSESTFTGANSNTNTSITGSVTDLDAKNGTYFVGEVRVNNDANTAGSTNYDFETASRVLSRISFTVSGLTVTPTDRGGTFNWTVGGVADSTFIHSQTLVVRLTGPTGDIKATQSIVPGTTTASISDIVNFSPSTMYYAKIEVVANDGWKATATPNSLSDDEYFNTLSARPVNTVAPTIGPLNNRGFLPTSTNLTATTGTWSNVGVGTVYAYNWVKIDSTTEAVSSTGFISNNVQSYTTDHVSDFLYVDVRATNPDTSNAIAQSTTYTLDQPVAVGNITPTTATTNVSTNFSFNISHYPTSYRINWGDGTPEEVYNVAANTSTVNASHPHIYTSAATRTITVTAQPGNKTNSAQVVVSIPAPTGSSFSRVTGTTTPSQPSTISFSSSNNQVTSSWTNGSPLWYVRFQGSGAGVNTNYTDAILPLMTSDVSNYSSSAVYTARVTNYYRSVNVSWNQSNTASFRIDYFDSVFGNGAEVGNNSSSSALVTIPWPLNNGAFTWTTLTLYSGANQTGTSTVYSNPVVGGFTPGEQSSFRENTVSLTFVPPPTLPTPTFGGVTRAVGGFSVSIANFDSNNIYTITASSGSVSRSGATITVSGLSNGASSTVSATASRAGFTNSATGQVAGTAANTPSAPQSLTRSTGSNFTKTFNWSAPSDNGGLSITSYEYSVNGGASWLTTSSSTSQSFTYSLGGTQSFSVRAVNAVGAGPGNSTSFVLPTATTPTASSITSSSATVSWTSTGQSSYSLSIPGAPGTPFTGTTQTSRSITGLSASTTYNPTVTVTSSTSDTFTSGTGSFATTGGNVAPSGGTYTFNPAAPPASGAVSLTITNVSGTPSTFTYAFVWRRATVSGIGNGTGTDRTYSSTALKTTTAQSSNVDSLSLTSASNNFWIRVETTVSNGVNPNLTSLRYVYVSNAN